MAQPQVIAVGVPVQPGEPKYITDASGVRRLNPAYLKQPSAPPAPLGLNVAMALPVCCSVEEHAAHLPAAELAPSVVATVEILHDPDAAAQVGSDGDLAMAALGRVFTKYSTPMGLVNKLMLLTEMDGLEFIVDDSGSMHGRRWAEVLQRLREMLEVLAHVPCPPVWIRFLNSTHVITLQHAPHEPPAAFYLRAEREVAQYFHANAPSGGTPAAERIEESLRRHPGRAVMRYFFGDGVPNGGAASERRIAQLLTHRADPARNPFTFISCTEDDAATQWMKDTEEVAPCCAEYDDFEAELAEVRGDQGEAFPYTVGFHLIGQLVGALCPDDMDCLDESAPLAKTTLENILGYRVNDGEYAHYYRQFQEAQRRRTGNGAADRVRREQDWSRLFAELCTVPVARMVPGVQDYKQRLRAAATSR